MLKGKYLEFANDLKEAVTEYRNAASITADTGTCNFDTCCVRLPRWKTNNVLEAAAEAECSAYKQEFFSGYVYMISPKGYLGQADRRTKAAEAMCEKLRELGYDTFVWYQMD